MLLQVMLSLHELEIVFALIDKELDRTNDHGHIVELEKLRTKLEDTQVIR